MAFEGKVVIVTGASSEIGAATALHFANLSARVVIVGRNEVKLNEVAQQVEAAKGIKPVIVKADMTDDSDVKRVIQETVKQFGQIDVLVNNAGAGTFAGICDGIQHFDNMISLNLRSVYLLTSLAVPYLIKTKGNIVNISSSLSVKANVKMMPYCVSKAGLDMFTKCIAKELAAEGIRVNSVNPGTVKTNILNSIGLNDHQVDTYIENASQAAPLGKIATSEDVAQLIAFLASKKANSITGVIYFIENGQIL